MSELKGIPPNCVLLLDSFKHAKGTFCVGENEGKVLNYFLLFQHKYKLPFEEAFLQSWMMMFESKLSEMPFLKFACYVSIEETLSFSVDEEKWFQDEAGVSTRRIVAEQ